MVRPHRVLNSHQALGGTSGHLEQPGRWRLQVLDKSGPSQKARLMALLEQACLTMDKTLRAEQAEEPSDVLILNEASQDVRRALVALSLLHEPRHTSEEHFFVEWG
jgi:hypothetical protein